MSDKHPYTPASGHVVQAINHLRRSFPAKVTADTLKKLGFAPKNESYVLNILRFVGLIDLEGGKTEIASNIFSMHDDTAFSQEFGKLVAKAYNDLFELHGDDTWDISIDSLITFFRSADETTAGVGRLQASTFQTLAAFAGHGQVPEPKSVVAKPPSAGRKKAQPKPKTSQSVMAMPIHSQPPAGESASLPAEGKKREFGLTVRIEINLPADGDQATYDRIFKSIRENLLDG